MSDTQSMHISEHIVEIRYKPNPQFLDYRGSFSTGLANELNLPHWRIDSNRIDVFNDQNSVKGFVSFNNLGLVIQDSCNRDFFSNQANKLIKYVLSQKPFVDPLSVVRIGVRSRFAFFTDMDFVALNEKYRTKYFTVSDEISKIYNNEIVDSGLFLNFKNRGYLINSQSGPMEKPQIKSYFPIERDDLPDAAFYVDLDYWKEPKKGVSIRDLVFCVKDFSFLGWDTAESIWKHMNG